MQNSTIMQQALAGLMASDPSALLDCFHDDIVWTIRGHTSWSGSHRGDGAVRYLLRQLASQIAGRYRLASAQVVAASGEYVTVEAQADVTLRDGQRYDNQYCWICRFEGHKLREVTEYMDTELVVRVLKPFEPSAERG